jgi:5-guanidino-2-oxopentanoate decarboxylase
MSQQRPLGAQISHALKARGVEVIFGIPGVHNIELYRGIEEAGIIHILSRHEQGAGFMADGYARATGKPGVAYVITGPGLCNIMTPMGQAYSDSVPMLVISSCLEREHRSLAHGRLHEMLDQEAAAATVCDWSHTAPDARGAYQLIDRAFLEFSTKRARPKHIQVPIDVLGALADGAPAPLMVPIAAAVSPSAVAQVFEALKSAKRPLIVFGGGAAKSDDSVAQATQLMATTGAACFTTYAARGLVAADHALNFGASLGRGASKEMIASADLVITIGSHLAEVDLWRDELGHTAPLVRVDIDPVVLSDWHRAEIPVAADGTAFMAALVAHCAQAPYFAAKGWEAAEVSRAKTRFRAEVNAERPGIVPIIDAIQAVLPPETTIYSDMTQFAYVGKEVYDLNQPNRWHHPTGFGTLGYGLPAAIGGKIGLGSAPVVAIAGDYGFHYTMQELGVAVELGLSLPIILWDNGKLKEIEDSMSRAQIAPNAVVARNPDFCKLAEAFGANSSRPADLAQLQTDLIAALTANGPTLIHVTPDIL